MRSSNFSTTFVVYCLEKICAILILEMYLINFAQEIYNYDRGHTINIR